MERYFIMSIRQKAIVLGLALIGFSAAITGGSYYVWCQALTEQGTKDTIVIASERYKRFALLTGGLIVGLNGLSTIAFYFFASHLLRGFSRITNATASVAAGDLRQPLPLNRHDEIGHLARAVQTMRERLTQVVNEVNSVTSAVQNGRLDKRGDVSKFSGDWQKLVVGMNTMLDHIETPHHVVIDYVNRIAAGELPNRMPEDAEGDFNIMYKSLNRLIDSMNEVSWLAMMLAGGNLDIDARERSEHDRLMKSLNQMIRQLQGLFDELRRLINAVQEGNLNLRGDVERFSGGWRNHLVGINTVLDAFVTPFHVAAAYVDNIAKGEVPEKIRDEYRGDFNTLKDNLNLLIDAMSDITNVAQEMAQGNLAVEVNERSYNDILMQSLNLMIQRLKEVVNDVNVSVRESTHYAEDVGSAITQMVSAMQQISDRIGIIEDIANQTRMLSLNATIEAARVQEQGKAFSVVAAEVRNLSNITKNAAEEIKQLAASSLELSQNIDQRFALLFPSIRYTAELVQKLSSLQ
ncbi:methyl-accepting chemotaxis sensory transducer [Candidatus Moduliflexus flocculans]|uniref:Methyl-accepting chemotaxis sensory transducer n=1 Tax=Candidatus Moduliflexus flocculans TaxID=1499966 RepID=A0A0S6VWD7_9BACT|nr:methyl-accepting chemotaxis sensory transducer [Candidatus Moduliflexus flocculans]